MQTRIIYLVDDDKIYQFASSRLMTRFKSDIEVKCFDDGLQAIEFISKHRDDNALLPDVILLDINMPVLDGWGFLEKFQDISDRLSKQVDIFIVSSSIDNRDIMKSQKYPEVKKYLVKPLNDIDYKMVLGTSKE